MIILECKKCGVKIEDPSDPYCPNCGVKMTQPDSKEISSIDDIEDNVVRIYRWQKPDESDFGHGYSISTMCPDEIETVLTHLEIVKQVLIERYREIFDTEFKGDQT